MEKLDALLSRLPEHHRSALSWFLDHAGHDQPWPPPMPDGTLLASRAKGIYKPNWTDYALSVRQTLQGPYPDREPVVRPDGTWSYLYFQEGEDPAERDAAYTNRGLVECLRNNVPIGVMRQVRHEPSVLYRVLGLALVSGWEAGYFFLEGFAQNGVCHGRGPRPEIEAITVTQEKAAATSHAFDPENIIDSRERLLASIVRRRGQPEFRRRLLEAYGGKCAVSGCDAVEALEAAHIVPYQGPETNHPSNGILLRADLHTLFDIGLLAIDTAGMTIRLSPSLAGTAYDQFTGQKVNLPTGADTVPSKDALDRHRAWAGL